MKTLTVCNELHKTDSVKYSDYFILLFGKVFHFTIISLSIFLFFFFALIRSVFYSLSHSLSHSLPFFFYRCRCRFRSVKNLYIFCIYVYCTLCMCVALCDVWTQQTIDLWERAIVAPLMPVYADAHATRTTNSFMWWTVRCEWYNCVVKEFQLAYRPTAFSSTFHPLFVAIRFGFEINHCEWDDFIFAHAMAFL